MLPYSTALVLGLLLPAQQRIGDVPNTPDKDLEGVWQVVSAVQDGKEIAPTDEKQRAIVTFKGGIMTMHSAGMDTKWSIRVDTTKSPRTIDLTLDAGPDKAKPSLGIYDVKGDELRMCHCEAGNGRPTDFTAKEGSQSTLATLRRIKQ
jgi:uncharacterized protein (TIGR03067 family)